MNVAVTIAAVVLALGAFGVMGYVLWSARRGVRPFNFTVGGLDDEDALEKARKRAEEIEQRHAVKVKAEREALEAARAQRDSEAKAAQEKEQARDSVDRANDRIARARGERG